MNFTFKLHVFFEECKLYIQTYINKLILTRRRLEVHCLKFKIGHELHFLNWDLEFSNNCPRILFPDCRRHGCTHISYEQVRVSQRLYKCFLKRFI